MACAGGRARASVRGGGGEARSDGTGRHLPAVWIVEASSQAEGPARTSRTTRRQPLTHSPDSRTSSNFTDRWRSTSHSLTRLTDQLELHGPLAVDLSPTSVGDVNVITGQPPSRDCSALQIAPQRRFCRATQHAACWRRYAVVCLSVRRDFCAVRIRNSAVTVGRRAFAVHGPMVWNSLPDDLRTQQDYESFRQGLKTWLFSRY